MKEKHCFECQEVKSVELFYKKTATSYRSPCKSCCNIRAKKWAENNPEKRKEIKKRHYELKGRTKQSQTVIKSRLKNMELYLYNAAKNRAAKYGIPFDMSIEDVVIPELCPVFKVPIGYNTEYSASLDRINPNFGYISGNVQVISRKANTMKSNASTEELRKFAEWILNG